MLDPTRLGDHPARKVFDYMVYRAEREGTGHSLTEEWYAGWFDRGVRWFFGVNISNAGSLLEDNQNPRAFAWYLKNCRQVLH